MHLHSYPHTIKILVIFLSFILSQRCIHSLKHYSTQRKLELREEVRAMFHHAYEGYLKHASGYDELKPLTCEGVDTWGSYSLTLIDALDTLATMGNFSEFRRVVKLLENMNFDKDINVSVFETNIRIVGGLLSAHLLSQKAGLQLEEGWPCQGPLLRLAEDIANRLLPAFDTATGMPYGTVNLRHGVPKGETAITCTAGVGTLLVEFGTLSRLTGNNIYEDVALAAMHAIWKRRSEIGLFGNHIDVQTGRWTALDSGIGAGVDSFFEYMVKGAILLQRPELLQMFHSARSAIDMYLRHDNWYVWAGMNKAQITLPVFQSLEAFWPGILSMVGDVKSAMTTMANYASVWKQYGFLPEFYNIPAGEASSNLESYPLRPELVESAMYLYRATKNEFLLEIGENMLRTIEHSAKTKCGYATIRNVVTHEKENRMESFFLAETTKYLYLLFDEDNFLHNDASHGDRVQMPDGSECLVNTGPYIFNTEAHPIDISALHCCHDMKQNIFEGLDLQQFNEDNLLKREREINERKNQEFYENCSPKEYDAMNKQKTKRTGNNKTFAKQTNPNQPTMTVDIEVYDEDNKPAADILIENFERIKNVPISRIIKEQNSDNISYAAAADNQRQLTATDLQEFLAKRKEHLSDQQNILQYIKGFMNNFTLDSNFIIGLQLFDKDISNILGQATQREFESSTKTLWDLYRLLQEYQCNVKLLTEFNLHGFYDAKRDMLQQVLLILNGDRTNATTNYIWQRMQEIYSDYRRSLVNTTAMQIFLLKILKNGTANDEKQHRANTVLTTADDQAFVMPPNLSMDDQSYKQNVMQLFMYAKRVVELKITMADTFEKLQHLIVESNKKEKSDDSSGNLKQNEHISDELIVMSKKPESADNMTARDGKSVSNTTELMEAAVASNNDNSSDSVWSQLLQTILRKTTPQRNPFDIAKLTRKTRNSLQQYYSKDSVMPSYDLFTCSKPKFIEKFAYRYYYP